MAARRDDELKKLLAGMNDLSLPALEKRMLALADLPRAPAIARVAEDFFAKFPVRFREQLGTACAATGVAWLHRAKLTNYQPVTAPNALVNAWQTTIPRAFEAARGPRGRVTKRIGSLPQATRAVFQNAWLALADSRNPDALEVLLARFAEGPATDVTERAIALLSFSVDGRIGDTAVAFLQRPSVRVSAEVPIFTVLALVLCVHGHRGHRKAVEDFVGQLPSLRWLEAALPDSVPVPVTKKPKTAPRDEADFLQYLAQAPHDDARRGLFMDWLLEQGSPRGEFMALQRAGRALTPKELKRLATLQKKHERPWLGSLATGHCKGTVRYRDGVLRELELSIWRGSQLPAHDEPLLATLERLRVEGGTNLSLWELFATGRCSSLVSLTAPLWVLEQVPDTVLSSLTEVGLIEPSLHDPRKPFAIFERHAFPKLESLRLAGRWWRDVEAFERLPQRAQLKRLWVQTTTPEPWLPLAKSLERLDVRSPDGST